VQGLLSLHDFGAPLVHWPPAHTSPTEQPFPSSHGPPLLLNVQPVAGLQASVVQTFPSLQVMGWPALQLPPAQTSFAVHALPSLQGRVLFKKEQPLAGTQVSVVQGLLSLQTTAAPGRHAPARQASPVVQAFPSLQGFLLGVWRHPSLGSQASFVQALLSLQFSGAPALQLPPWHASPEVQELLSLQGKLLFVKTQPVAGAQLSLVQMFPSLQVMGAPGVHTPATHASPLVHALPSEQGSCAGMYVQPLAGSQVSIVHTLPSLHSTSGPPLQLPPAQTSFSVQAFWSSHGCVFGVKMQPT
jgi:hypothetical protein